MLLTIHGAALNLFLELAVFYVAQDVVIVSQQRPLGFLLQTFQRDVLFDGGVADQPLCSQARYPSVAENCSSKGWPFVRMER